MDNYNFTGITHMTDYKLAAVPKQDHIHALRNTSEEFLKSLTGLEVYILEHIIFYASKHRKRCEKSYSKIAEERGCSLSTVKRLMKKLCGLVEVAQSGTSKTFIYVSDALRRAWKAFNSGREPAMTPLAPNTIYKKQSDDRSLTLDESFREAGASKEEAAQIKSSMTKSKVTRASLSSPVRYIAKCLENLRSRLGGQNTRPERRIITDGQVEAHNDKVTLWINCHKRDGELDVQGMLGHANYLKTLDYDERLQAVIDRCVTYVERNSQNVIIS